MGRRVRQAHLLQDSLDGCLLIVITLWDVTVLEGHSVGVLSLQNGQALGEGQDFLLCRVLLLQLDCCLSQQPALLLRG